MMIAVDIALFLEKFGLIVVVILAALGIALYTTFAERKVAGIIQDRRGPNRAGPFGLLQPLADGVKMIMKEEIIPLTSNKWLFILGPNLAMITAMMTSAVIPWGNKLELFGRTIDLQIADINIGVLYIFGVVSMGVYGIMIGGWASNNKFSLIAAVRGASQIISYELAMGLSLIALLMITGSLSTKTIVEQQMANGVWNVVLQPLGFLIFLICAFAETNRTPYINMIMSSALMATLFFGGYDIPFVNEVTLSEKWGTNIVTVLGTLMLLTKIVGFLFFFMWVRWTIPRFRYDQLMDLGWKKLIPLALINMLVTGAVILWLNK
jgi:NADH-quinone oxidoreductase subunit H